MPKKRVKRKNYFDLSEALCIEMGRFIIKLGLKETFLLELVDEKIREKTKEVFEFISQLKGEIHMV